MSVRAAVINRRDLLLWTSLAGLVVLAMDLYVGDQPAPTIKLIDFNRL
jgi:hypothetical protein